MARATQALVDLDFESCLEHLASALAGYRLERVGDRRRSCFDDPKRVILCHCGVPPIRELIPHRKGTPRPQPARPELHATGFPHILTLAHGQSYTGRAGSGREEETWFRVMPQSQELQIFASTMRKLADARAVVIEHMANAIAEGDSPDGARARGLTFLRDRHLSNSVRSA
jgi:hypothetical protein